MCFGVLSYLQLLLVNHIAGRNDGTAIQEKYDSFGEDAAIVASMLNSWNVPSRLLPSALGKDEYGRKVAAIIKEQGLDVNLTFDPNIKTVFEISIADNTGDRTYYYQRSLEAVATLDRPDISILGKAGLLYVDWYDGEHILRPIEAAAGFGVPIFVNIEQQFDNHELLKRLSPASFCQVTLEDSQTGAEMAEAASRVLEAGIDTVLVTAGARGSLASDGNKIIRVEAPKTVVADGNGAGCCFAAGFIYGRLQEWSLEQCTRFATAQASLKCSRVGYIPFPVVDGERLAKTLTVESGCW